jgi:hypothetical protein
MLPLDDPRWSSLHHAYGPAANVPDELRALAAGGYADEELWHDLWSELCHQGTANAAGRAAVAHLVAIASTLPPPAQRQVWHLVAAIALSDAGSPLPADLRPSYDAALVEAEAQVRAAFVPGLDAGDALWLAISLASLRRLAPIEAALNGLINGEHECPCPSCDEDLSIPLTAPPFVVHLWQPTVGQDGPTAPTHARIARPALESLASLVRTSGHASLADQLLALDVSATCPSCGATFELLADS